MSEQSTESDYRERAERAEAQVARVEALATRLHGLQDTREECAVVARQIRDALSSTPGETDD